MRQTQKNGGIGGVSGTIAWNFGTAVDADQPSVRR